MVRKQFKEGFDSEDKAITLKLTKEESEDYTDGKYKFGVFTETKGFVGFFKSKADADKYRDNFNKKYVYN